MKELWVKTDHLDDWNRRKKLVTTALESGANAVIVKNEDLVKVRQLGVIKVGTIFSEPKKIPKEANEFDIPISTSESGQYHAKWSGFYKEIKSKEDEQEIVQKGKHVGYVIVNAKDWKIIPLENIIAGLQGKTKIIVEVKDVEEAKVALETLEIGSDGVLLKSDASEIKKVKAMMDEISTEKLKLIPVKVTKVQPVGMGDRSCVDTCSMFNLGEGLLVGSQSNALFLVHSETLESEYVASRPFRVNAGPVHAYVLVPGGKTRYLSEISAGDEVLGVNSKGETRPLIVGRSKIEKRPLLLVEAEIEGKKIKTLLQNAETICLVDKNGKAISVTKLEPNETKVLAYIEDVGRHFGMKVKETVEEK